MDESAAQAWAAARPTKNHTVSTVCPAPWVSIEFDPSGWVYACCTSGMYPLGRIGEQRLKDLWGGPRAMVLRDALARWDLTVACGPCRWHLEHGRTDPVAAVYDQYPVSSNDPERPFMMLFALSNRCNLGCVMCNPELSTKLRIEAGLPALVSRYDEQFFEDLEPLLEELKLAKFLGGEPFLVPEHKRVWEMMAKLDEPPRIQVTTNGTIWNRTVEWLFDTFSPDISISVDAATADTYAKVRRGGDFDELLANVDRFADACRRGGSELHVSYCLLTENWHELGAFLAWAERFDIPSSINLVTDEGLAIHDLDLASLLEIRDHWRSEDAHITGLLDKNLGVWQTQLRQMDAVIEERRSGIAPAPRQAQPAPENLFAGASPSPREANPWRRHKQRVATQAAVTAHRRRLGAWSDGGPVGIITADQSGRITEVLGEHPRLGILRQDLVGSHLDSLVVTLERARSAPAWIVEIEDSAEQQIRTLVLSTERPVRGASGSIVRTITLPTPSGTCLLLAEDRIYEHNSGEPAATQPIPVSIARGRTTDAG